MPFIQKELGSMLRLSTLKTFGDVEMVLWRKFVRGCAETNPTRNRYKTSGINRLNDNRLNFW